MDFERFKANYIKEIWTITEEKTYAKMSAEFIDYGNNLIKLNKQNFKQ